MQETDAGKELGRLDGALEALGLVRERLQVQRSELGPETALEAVDEMLTLVDALLTEFQHRRQHLLPHHRSFQFLLSDAGVIPLAHDTFVALMRGEAAAAAFAGQTLRLADWYVRMEGEVPAQVVNESYTWLPVDAGGRADLHAARRIAESPLPSEAEREAIRRRLFASTRQLAL